MVKTQTFAAKYWRIAALALLFAACLTFNGGMVLYWLGLALFMLTDLGRNKESLVPQPARSPSVTEKFWALSFSLILVVPLAFCAFGPARLALILPEIIVAIGFSVSMYLVFASYHRAAKRKDILKGP
jgi:hypothetical protein